MTPQEIYNTVVSHLLAQGEPARIVDNTGAQCMYRTPDGKKCAIGVLIPDADYDPAMEGLPVLQLLDLAIDSLAPYREHVGLLQGLQRAHDTWNDTGMDSLLLDLSFVAKEHNLSSAV